MEGLLAEKWKSEIMEDCLKIRFKIKLRDLYEFVIYMNYVSIRGVITFLFCLTLIGGLVFYGDELPKKAIAVVIIFLVLFVLIMPLELFVKTIIQHKRSFSEEYQYEFKDKGIKISNSEQEQFIDWSYIYKVGRTKNLILVYLSKMRAFILPVKACEGKEKELIDYINDKIELKNT